jgi:hypothetical protein
MIHDAAEVIRQMESKWLHFLAVILGAVVAEVHIRTRWKLQTTHLSTGTSTKAGWIK